MTGEKKRYLSSSRELMDPRLMVSSSYILRTKTGGCTIFTRPFIQTSQPRFPQNSGTHAMIVKEVKPPFGNAGWLKEDKAIFANDEFDVWKIPTDGTARYDLHPEKNQA
ncbi:MAG: hypothetical protein MZV63_34095 [Marinilabiliales bacterium]|nr:hypothetical protein [Marinilabiliales bacterium]